MDMQQGRGHAVATSIKPQHLSCTSQSRLVVVPGSHSKRLPILFIPASLIVLARSFLSIDNYLSVTLAGIVAALENAEDPYPSVQKDDASYACIHATSSWSRSGTSSQPSMIKTQKCKGGRREQNLTNFLAGGRLGLLRRMM